ncbi:MAG: ABC transporter permease [Ardenticatenales bacterium]|nr:ABC transporter permease [Ardenticatenales bacterium]
MTEFWRIALHEYKRIALKRSFILALLSVPWMIGLNVGLGFFLESGEKDHSPVGYVDHAGLLANPIPAPVSGSGKPVEFIPFPTEDEARSAVESGEIQAYYVVAADYFSTTRIDLAYLEEPGRNATRQFYDFVQINLLSDQPPEIALLATSSTNVMVRSLDGSRQFPRGGPTFGLIMPLLVSIAFLLLLLMNSGYLLQAVADEKENRTMEVLVTSVSPLQLIGGKIVGIAAIGLTQLIVWTVVCLLAIVIAGRAGIDWFQDLSVDWSIIAATAVIAIPSYVLASALMTAIGATVVSAQEGQPTGALVSVLHIIPVYLSWAIVETPNAALPTVLSFLPFTSLVTVSLRNLFGVVPWWQVAASVAIQTLWAAGALWLAGRAFRLGMLRYGQRLNWRELIKARSQ